MNRVLVEIWMLMILLLRSQKKVSSRESIFHLREFVNCPEQTVGRIMDIKSTVGEGSEGNKEHVIGNWRKGNSFYVVAESLGECVLHLCGKQNL